MDQAISSADLRDVLRFSLKATSRSSILDFERVVDATTAGPPIDESDPRIRRLVEQILFSRRFILTYYAVLAVVLATLATVHWTRHFRRLRQRRNGGRISKLGVREGVEDSMEDRVDSSSSSTLEGTMSPPTKLSGSTTPANEETPLIIGSHSRTASASLRSRIRGWLMYQPADIPSCNVHFPSNATSALILIFVLINLFYLFYHVPLTIPMLFAFADRAGLVFVANLPVLYVLASKNQPMKWLIGSSYESLNIFHRRLGELMIFLALVHTIGMFGVWYTLLQRIGFSLSRFLASKVIILGICSFVTYETIYFTSTTLFRQQWYELFLGLHVVLQVVALVLLWFHHHNSRIYVAVAFLIFCLDRIVVRMTLRTRTVKARLKIMADQETVQISSNKLVEEQGLLHRLICGDISAGWAPTDHIFLTIPSLSRKHIIQAHPFTIASRAPSAYNPESNFKLIIRAQDGFSKDLLKYAESHDSVVARIDGPYGAQSPVTFLQHQDLAIVITGGSGIAVALPLVWSLIHEDSEGASSASLPRKILFVWIFHDKKHLLWVGPEELNRLSKSGVEVMPCLGRRDLDKVMRTWIAQESGFTTVARPKIGVVVSGPDNMNREVRNSCADMAFEGQNISVEVEKYGW